ncbi:hypothetical protein V7128_01820 [Neobacillus vireti]|uniref:hypothetical protein n=1 Tax=Neobacillus vireti TaxID=220686 RepID=UPI002FFFBFAC
MSVRKAGKRSAGNQRWTDSHKQIYEYKSPDVSFECEKLTKEELEKLSGEVTTYNIKDLNKDK